MFKQLLKLFKLTPTTKPAPQEQETKPKHGEEGSCCGGCSGSKK